VLLSIFVGVIIWTGGRESVLGTADRVKQDLLADEDEEILALVAADMHQDAGTWEAVWQKDEERTPPLLDISPMSEEVEMELLDIFSDVDCKAKGRSNEKLPAFSFSSGK